MKTSQEIVKGKKNLQVFSQMLYGISIINLICLSPWLVLYKYGSCIPRTPPGICVSKGGDIDCVLSAYLTHMNKNS